MADATQGDTGVQSLGLLVLALIALIAGLLIHSFIIGVNVSDWWKGRSVTAVDHIVTSLGISRMCAPSVHILLLFLHKLYRSSLDTNIALIFLDIVYTFFNYASIWLTSLLSIVLCLKISNFHSRLFLYLRGVIIHRTGFLIVASGLLSAFNSLMLFSVGTTEFISGHKYNASMGCSNSNNVYIYTIGSSIPLLFCCISSVLLFSSLYHHTTKMKMSSNLSISLETYYSVMRFIAVTFIYNTLYYTVDSVYIFYYFVYCLHLPWLYVVLDFLPVLHSSYLIYKTAKLRSKMSKVLHNVTDLLFQRKVTETGENIEVVAQ